MGKFVDLTGRKFGRLTVIERAESSIDLRGKKRTMWKCLCDCGNTAIVGSDPLVRGAQVQCGCYRSEALRNSTIKHGQTNTKLYGVWSAMKHRCYNENDRNYHSYGGRGITVCDEWRNSFENFCVWAYENGYTPDAKRGECTLDRVDVNGQYSPDNCRFIQQVEQMQNVRYNVRLEYNGETHTIAEWGRITGINAQKIRNRISVLNWSVERALTTM